MRGELLEKRDMRSGPYWVEARRLAGILNDHAGPHGFPVTLIDGETGEIFDQRPLVYDLGDYAPFVAFLGEETKDAALHQWALDQGRRTIKMFQDPEGFFSLKAQRDGEGWDLVWIDRLGDTLLGLVLLFCLSHDAELRRGIGKFLLFLKTSLGSSGGIDRGFFRFGERRLPFPIACPSYMGTFAEECLVFFEETKDASAKELAEAMTEFWLKDAYFQAVGLFPSRAWTFPDSPFLRRATEGLSVFPSMAPFRQSEIAKLNTNVIHALLRLYETTREPRYREALLRWFASARTLFSCGGGLYDGFWEARKGHWNDGQLLSQNVPMMNALLEGAVVLEDHHLRQDAREALGFWMRRQDQTALFPEDPRGGKSRFSGRALLDCQTDMIVLLLKAFCLEGDKRYLTAAKRCLTSTLHYFKTERSLGWAVDLNSFKLIASKIHLKFIGLLIKPILLLEAVENGQDIVRDRRLCLLSRDR